MYNLDKLTRIYEKFNITPNQFFVLYAVYKKDWDNLYRYVNNVSNKMNEEGKKITGFNVEEELFPLVEKGYLDNIFNKGHSFEVIDLMVTPHFADAIFIDTEQAGQELYDSFPQWINVNGGKQVAKKGGDINGVYFGKDQMLELYAKKIGNDRELHSKIIEATERGKEQGLINFTLRSYIYDEMWTSYMDLEDKTTKFTNI